MLANLECHLALVAFRTIEGILALEKTEKTPSKELVNTFLHLCFQQHQLMCQAYQQKPEEERKPMILTTEGMEVGRTQLWRGVDTNRFLVPNSLLQKSTFSTSSSPILPLLRCLGIAHSLRLISALLSERRVILISSSPTRLATCCRSALAALAQGLLHWQHFLIPVLPPHLSQYLQAPFPYLIGVLRQAVDVSKLHELGEVLMINLDTNELETRNIPTHLIATRLPDVFGGSRGFDVDNVSSSSDVLAQDLVELLKSDKKVIFGDTNVVGEQAAKAAKAVKSAMKSSFGKLRQQGRKLLNQGEDVAAAPEEQQQQEQPVHAVTEDEIYTEGSQNEMGEEEARVAFCTFFLCLYGDLKWYLGAPATPGDTPRLNRDQFLAAKSRLGEGQATPIYPLLQNLCQSQMFEQFVKARVEEIRTRVTIGKDSPLFLVCANYHRQHNIDFGVINVRRVTRQVASANPSRLISQANANARRMAMTLTSNRQYEGDHAKAVAQLVEYCHETSVLMDVMSVMWMRLRTAKNTQWRHALLALQIIRNLLYHGPLAAIAEATDGLDKIREMKMYKDHMRAQTCQQVQVAAIQVFGLLVDRARLFEIRRYCCNRRREIRDNCSPKYQRDRQISIALSFRALHPYLHPQNNRQAPPARILYQPPPPDRPSQQQQHYAPQSSAQSPHRGPPPQGARPPQQRMPQHGAVHSAVFHAAPRQQAAPVDLLGVAAPAPQQQQVQASFGAMNINDPFGSPPPQPTIAQIPPQPTIAQVPPQQPRPPQPQPTIAQVPPQPYGQQPPPAQQQQPPYGAQPGFGSPSPHVPPQGAHRPPPQQPTMVQMPPQQYGQQPGYPGHAAPGHAPPGHAQPGHAQPGQFAQRPPGHAPAPHQAHPGYPPQGPHPGYPAGQPPPQQQPNMFAAHPPQQQPPPPQQQRPPARSQFDPFA